MEKEAAVIAMDPKDPRILNFDAPIISTRRPHGATSLELCQMNSRGASRDTHNRVPFSWEQSAGKPKDDSGSTWDTDDFPIPPPRPPPGRRLPEHEYDGDDDFSDTVDTFSLSAAIDMVESAEMARQNNRMLGGVSLESSGDQSPSFMIQRFLSDAKALASSSGLPILKNISNQPENCLPQTAIDTPPRGCSLGLSAFFPWRMKHKPPCSVKSPVRVMSASVNSQWGMKEKQKQKQKKKQKSSLAGTSIRNGV